MQLYTFVISAPDDGERSATTPHHRSPKRCSRPLKHFDRTDFCNLGLERRWLETAVICYADKQRRKALGKRKNSFVDAPVFRVLSLLISSLGLAVLSRLPLKVRDFVGYADLG